MIAGRRISVIDIGSNSVRLLIADVNRDGIKELHKSLNTTRLYKAISQDYKLDSESMQRTADAIAEYVKIAEDNSSDEVYMFATAAVRVAVNRGDFVRLIKDKTKIIPEIISEEKEAAMAFAGVECDEVCGVIDIGGASTEAAVGSNGHIISAKSSKIGAVKCKEILKTDVSLKDIEYLAESILLNECKETIAVIKNLGKVKWFGVGGTITTMAAMLRGLEHYDSSIINQTDITPKEVDKMIKSIINLDIEDRKKIKGLQESRADIIVYGLVILKTIMKYCDMESMRASDNDNLTGYIKLMLKEI